MRRAIRLRIWQQMPNYRKPASFLIRESYPLPPYSTVIGMIHNACGFTEYHDMDLCIQGENASETSDYATYYNFGIKYDPTRHQAKVSDGKGGFDGINISPKSIHVLTDVNLLIYICPKNENDFDTIINGLKKQVSYLSLGRHEDIVRIDEINEIQLQESSEIDEDESYCSKYDMYIPVSICDLSQGMGTVYSLNKRFDNSGKTRQWSEIVDAVHVKKEKGLSLNDMLLDSELENPVCLG